MDHCSLEKRISHLEKELQKISLQNSHLSESLEKALSTVLPKVDALLSNHGKPLMTSAAPGISTSEKVSPMSSSPCKLAEPLTLLEAASVGDAKTFVLLVQSGANPMQRNGEGATPLHLAAAGGHEQILVELIQGRRLSVHVKGPRLRTPLHLAAVNGRENSIRYLVSVGAQLNAKDVEGYTPLMLAVRAEQLGATILLLTLGAPRERHNDETLLTMASESGGLKLLSYLLKNKITEGEEDLKQALGRARNIGAVLTFEDEYPGILQSEKGAYAMRFAAFGGRKETIKALNDAGVDIDSVSNTKWTTFLLAAEGGHSACLRILLERGSKRDVKNKDGWNALHLAAAKGHLECLDLLLDSGMKINSINPNRDSPLSIAAAYGRAKCVTMLLDRGANINHVNRDGLTALDCAENENERVCIKILQQRMRGQ